jgi:hypothetical protein
MKKIDLKKELKSLYNPPEEIVLVDVPGMNFLMIDGEGNPNTAQEYKDAIEALYAVSFSVIQVIPSLVFPGQPDYLSSGLTGNV